jgi:geranylgeranyl diphosphate synthase type II
MNKEKLNQLLESCFDQLELDGQPSELYEPMAYIMGLGGKRLRPRLCLSAASLYTKEVDKEEILNIAIALELFHNFSLIHDDIMDEAPLRRGRATVHKKWNRDIAILSGDAMLVKAYDYLSRSGNRELSAILQQFNQSALRVCEGQQMDMNFEQDEPTSIQINDYLHMISLKTAELIACSLKLGALAAGAKMEEAEKLYDFGINLGMAFQVQDDYLDAFGNQAAVGKQTGGDILADKKTVMTLLLAEKMEEDYAIFKKRLAKLPAEQKIKITLEEYRRFKVDIDSRKLIDDYTTKAEVNLHETSLPAEQLKPLLSLTQKLKDRNS